MGRRWTRSSIPSWAARKRWAWPGDLNSFPRRSRRRVGWCEFSARLSSPPVLSMPSAGRGLSPRSIVAPQLVRNYDTGRPAPYFQQPARRANGGLLVAPALHEDVEHHAVLVHRTPEPARLAGDGHDLAAAPPLARRRPTPPVLVGKTLPELEPTLAHGPIADHDAAGGRDLVHVAEAQGKVEVELDRVADDLARIAIAGVARTLRPCHCVRLPGSAPAREPTGYQFDGALKPRPAPSRAVGRQMLGVTRTLHLTYNIS